MNCFICDRVFGTLSTLQLHVRASHAIDRYNTFTCKQDQCHRKFNKIRILYNHIRSKHSVNIVESELITQNTNIDLTTCTLVGTEQGVLEASEDDLYVKEEDLNFVLKLYNKLHITRSDIDFIIKKHH